MIRMASYRTSERLDFRQLVLQAAYLLQRLELLGDRVEWDDGAPRLGADVVAVAHVDRARGLLLLADDCR